MSDFSLWNTVYRIFDLDLWPRSDNLLNLTHPLFRARVLWWFGPDRLINKKVIGHTALKIRVFTYLTVTFDLGRTICWMWSILGSKYLFWWLFGPDWLINKKYRVHGIKNTVRSDDLLNVTHPWFKARVLVVVWAWSVDKYKSNRVHGFKNTVFRVIDLYVWRLWDNLLNVTHSGFRTRVFVLVWVWSVVK